MYSQTGGDRVTINVGQGTEQQSFVVAKDLLVARSTWFAKALEGQFLEASSNIINLPDDPPTAYAALLFYLHHGNLNFTAVGPGEPSGVGEQIHECALVWILGDKYDLPTMQNCAMRRACTLFADHGGDMWLDTV